MAAFIALLRAVNVGGRGRLAATELKAACEAAGFSGVKTYIQSGNAVFATQLQEDAARFGLQQALLALTGQDFEVFLCSRAAFDQMLAASPLGDGDPARSIIYLFQTPPDPAILDTMMAPDGETVSIIGHAVHVHYPTGSGRSKLKLKGLERGTGRNLNTLRKLSVMAAECEGDET
ncbi:DUF1697 domain-containing protein [Martelella alba]|uniref:DUF1697 domain-containing protein n=1 Tax=Martelella alba TaxID=2590451 RepID=A0A506UB78_9HYPH|nr:DUF1697 domain-containing protein [Martelella alba]TPW31623.1 DUF1697 domain-containing protein [Martelella alba]